MTRRTLICRLLIGGGILFYLAALAVALIGTQGWFGVQPDGLAAVYLIVLGTPWTLVMAPLLMMGLPILIGQMVALAAPLLNLYILRRICRRRDARD